MVVAARSRILVVASGDAGVVAAVACVRRRGVVVVTIVGGVDGLVTSLDVSGVIAIWLPLAIVGVRHANGSVRLGRGRERSLAELILFLVEFQLVASRPLRESKGCRSSGIMHW